MKLEIQTIINYVIFLLVLLILGLSLYNSYILYTHTHPLKDHVHNDVKLNLWQWHVDGFMEDVEQYMEANKKQWEVQLKINKIK